MNHTRKVFYPLCFLKTHFSELLFPERTNIPGSAWQTVSCWQASKALQWRRQTLVKFKCKTAWCCCRKKDNKLVNKRPKAISKISKVTQKLAGIGGCSWGRNSRGICSEVFHCLHLLQVIHWFTQIHYQSAKYITSFKIFLISKLRTSYRCLALSASALKCLVTVFSSRI